MYYSKINIDFLTNEQAKIINFPKSNLSFFRLISGSQNIYLTNGFNCFFFFIKLFKGKGIFDSLILNGQLENEHYLILNSDSILSYNEQFILDPKKYEYKINNGYYSLIKIQFRFCMEGEVFRPEINS